jgi:hypothetical protein
MQQRMGNSGANAFSLVQPCIFASALWHISDDIIADISRYGS